VVGYKMAELYEGQFLYAAVKMGDRGQVVIPKEAREHFRIKVGDKLVVGGDLKKGIAITTLELMKKIGNHHSHKEGNEQDKRLYGTVTCGETYQIVIPKEARADFQIEPGEKLLVFGDINKGIALTKANIVKELAVKILTVVNGLPHDSEIDE
jgi:AbrB family looped-hinge helix DNA binding protein